MLIGACSMLTGVAKHGVIHFRPGHIFGAALLGTGNQITTTDTPTFVVVVVSSFKAGRSLGVDPSAPDSVPVTVPTVHVAIVRKPASSFSSKLMWKSVSM